MQCNIDARGKAYRLRAGIGLIVVGASLIALQQFGGLANQKLGWHLYVGLAALAFGSFGVFQGWTGWCVVRAMGFKTRA